jgi:hypothetical protein
MNVRAWPKLLSLAERLGVFANDLRIGTTPTVS